MFIFEKKESLERIYLFNVAFSSYVELQTGTFFGVLVSSPRSFRRFLFSSVHQNEVCAPIVQSTIAHESAITFSMVQL